MSDTAAGAASIVGKHGVGIAPPEHATEGYRTYEIYQRERVGESTHLIPAGHLGSPEFLADPHPTLSTLRENYPCYRDWAGNQFWITRYDDVTSIFVDDPNYETRTKSWFYGRPAFGRDLRHEVVVLEAQANGIDQHVGPIAERLAADIGDGFDLATGFAARLPLELLGAVLDVPAGDLAEFGRRYWLMQRGAGWHAGARQAGLDAIDELIAYFDPLVEKRRSDPGADLVSAIATLEIDGVASTKGADVVATLLEGDHETLHGALANMWMLLLTHPEQLAQIEGDRRFVKLAYLEAVRHSPPVMSALRFARHEVERFGRLIPEGGLLVCSAGAANRDPRVFEDPDAFDINRKDLCHREARGMYRADGLATAICFGLGKPSKHPAEPEDRPRSIYAITRDAAVTASMALLDAAPGGLALAPNASPKLTSLRVGEMHICWRLPVSV